MGRRRRPLARSPSLIKVVKRRGKLVVGRVEGDPRCLVDFCLWPVWWNRLRDKLRESVALPSRSHTRAARLIGSDPKKIHKILNKI